MDRESGPGPLAVGANQLELLEFSMLEEREHGTIYEGFYGINVYKVRHVIPWPAHQSLPGQASHLLGLFSYRGEVIPLVNLRTHLGLGPSPEAADRMVVVADLNDVRVGFAINTALKVRRLGWQLIRKPPENQAETVYRNLVGLALLEDRLIRILDVEQIIAVMGLGAAAGAQERVDEAVVRSAADGTAAPPPMELDQAAPGTGPRLVMVVDDSAMMRNMVGSLCQSAGWTPLKMKDGLEAWERLEAMLSQARQRRVPFGELLPLILADVEMPRMDGFTLTRRVREHPEMAGVKVVIHTSLGGPENRAKALAMGADEIAVKFDPDTLLATFRRLMGDRIDPGDVNGTGTR